MPYKPYEIEKINSDNRRPGDKHLEGYLVRYRPHPDFGWTGRRTYASLEEAEDFVKTLCEKGDIKCV
jgi:hypothetical protein